MGDAERSSGLNASFSVAPSLLRGISILMGEVNPNKMHRPGARRLSPDYPKDRRPGLGGDTVYAEPLLPPALRSADRGGALCCELLPLLTKSKLVATAPVGARPMRGLFLPLTLMDGVTVGGPRSRSAVRGS